MKYEQIPALTKDVKSHHSRLTRLERSNLVTPTFPIGSGSIGEAQIIDIHIAPANVNGTHIAPSSIATTHVQADAINASHIVANAITADELAANSVTATELSADSVNAGHIQADSVTASEIATDTITANEIATDTITANEIATDTITASEIAAGTITSSEIYSGGVEANRIQAVNIASGAITSGKIAVGAVAAGNIEAGALNAFQITGANIRTSASNPKVDFTSAGIRGFDSAGNITFALEGATGKLTTLAGLGGPNLLRDSSFEKVGIPDWGIYDGFPSSPGVTLTRQSGSRRPGSPFSFGARLQRNSGGSSSNSHAGAAQNVSSVFGEGKQLVWSAWVKPSGAPLSIRLYADWTGAGAAYQSASQTPTVLQSNWQRVSFAFTVTNWESSGSVYIWIEDANDGEWIDLDDVQLEEGTLLTSYGRSPHEILPNEVTSTELQDNIFSDQTAVTNHFAAGVFPASRIVADSISATQIAADAIGVTELAANSVTAVKILAGEVTGTKLSADAIDGKVVTGATIRTAATNPRIEMNSTEFFKTDSSGSKAVRITPGDGIDLLAGSSIGGAPTDRKIRWLDPNDTSSTVMEFETYQYFEAFDSTTHRIGRMEVISPTNVSASARIQAMAGANAAYITAMVEDNASSSSWAYVYANAGSEMATLLDQDGGSKFLKLTGAVANKVINWGTTTLTWPGGGFPFSDQPTVNHGLGTTPTLVLATIIGGSVFNTQRLSWASTLNYTSTQFAIGAGSLADPGAGATATVAWVAMGTI